MAFYTQNNKTRPVRLSPATRRYAEESLSGRYGRDALSNGGITLDGICGFSELSRIEKYDIAIKMIAEQAPIRICDGERISGAATLGAAIRHVVPASYGGKYIFPSISHLTVDFETVLRRGIRGIREDAERGYAEHRGTEREPFATSCLNTLDAFEIWHSRYLDALDKLEGYEDNYNNLVRAPLYGATSFYEAVQSLWFCFAFLRLCGNWPGIGRLDVLLGEYLRRDLERGDITLDDAREILAHFFIKGCEWINGTVVGSGDAQHYQNIVLSGIDEDGNDVTNEVTYLVLDILEELGIGDFPTTVRINKNTDEGLLLRIAQVMQFGGGIIAVYNEDLVIRALVKDGYPEREARRFANDGCWEVQIPGETYFIYESLDSLRLLQETTLCGYDGSLDFSSFDELLERYLSDLSGAVEALAGRRIGTFKGVDPETGEWIWKEQIPCTAVSIFERGCIERGLSYLEGGPIYNIYSPHIGGLADTVNSLYAIKKLVFDDKIITLPALLSVLKNDWEGEDTLRLHALNKYSYYGNDNPEVDALAAKLLSTFADACAAQNGKCGLRFPVGVSTFGRQIEWADSRLATPFGKRAHDVLAANCSPTPGTDRAGATAVICSYCSADHTRLASGSALDLRLMPSSVEGERGAHVIVSLIKSFVALGGFFMQPDVVDAGLLREAQAHPENYASLAVRVSGWNARFATLDRRWQDMVISQAEH